ncbi:unnamed protein product [Prunus brigantina]
MHCDADITERQTELDRLRVHLFLAGLDPQFDQVRGEILRKDPKLDLDQTFAYVRREAQQRLTMAGTPDICSSGHSTSEGPSTLYHKHTRARCYELIGYPDWWDHSKAPRRNKSTSLHTSSVTDPVSPGAPPAPAPASASVATSGTQGYVLRSSSKKHTWVIDTGATDHMTFDPGQIISHTPPSQSVVSNANGTPSPDILSSKTIGCGTRRGKLYYLDLASDSEASLSQAYKIGGTSVEKKTSEVLRSDNGGEFLNHDLNEFFQAHGIIHQRSCPSTPQQNAHHTREERIEEFMPAPENSSAPVPHQSSAEDVIQVTSLPETDNINEITDCISEGAEPTYQIPKRTNRGKPPVHYEADINAKGKYPINNYVSLTRLSESRVHFVKQLAEIPVPNSVTEALEDQKWKEAMNEEMRALQKNGTWELVPLPHGKKTVGCRWIYTVKLKADGSVERYKARLVAKGYTQRYGIDYQETFAPVAKIKTIRILLSLAANLDWPLHQFDVKNAFLHGDLEEEVYMDLPPGCNFTRDKGNQVCKLKKSLYGLKQSPRAWFGRFTKSMKFFGYTQSNADHTLFLKRDGKKLTALIVYVDDIVVTGNDTGEQLKLQKYLSQEFEMKDLGDLKYFLGIEVARSANGICVVTEEICIGSTC